jgi:ankyrin repeat protein
VALCGAEVDLLDANGCTALFYAVTLGHADCAQLLLDCGANPNHQDKKGRTYVVSYHQKRNQLDNKFNCFSLLFLGRRIAVPPKDRRKL